MPNTNSIILLTLIVVFLNFNSLQAQKENTMTTDNLQQTILDIFIGADKRDWPRVEKAFAATVTLDYSSMIGGEPTKLSPQQITDSWKALLPGFEATQHQISNFTYNIADQSARVSAYGTATHYLPNPSGRNIWIVVGTYDFEMHQENETWKVSAMTFSFKYQDGNTSLPQMAQDRVQGKTTIPSDGTAVIEAFFEALETQQFDRLLEIFTEDARQINAYIPDGFPESFDGRAAIHKQYSSLPQNFGQMNFPRTIYSTSNPDVYFVKFQGEIEIKAGGEYNNDYIGIFRLKDGLIHEYTEYFNPIVMAKAFGITLK